MSQGCPFSLHDEPFAALVEDFIAQRPQVRAASSREEYRLAPHAFRSWWLDKGHAKLDEDVVKAWILHRCARAAVMTVSLQTLIVSLFVDFLVLTGRSLENPFQSLRRKHKARGIRGIVRLLAETRSIAQLDERGDVPFSGPLGQHFRRYLEYRSTLSMKGGTHEVYLASFERFLRERRIDDLTMIDHALIEEWNGWQGESTEYNHRYRMLIIGKYFDFLVGRRFLECSPVPELPRHRRRSLPPYIYSRDEVRRILAAAEALEDHHLLPYRGPTYRTFMLTLYTLGLRRKEALDLRLNDIDFNENTLVIREGKFRKGRVLPFGPR
jgi:site-specific recombinase XerD